MIGTFYAHIIGFQKLVDSLKKIFPKGKIIIEDNGASKRITLKTKEGFFSSSNLLKFTYRERLEPGYQISDREDCQLNENLKGLHSFVEYLPVKNEKVKGLFLKKIETFNSEFSIFQEKGKTKNIKELVFHIAKEFEAVLFVKPGTEISKSEKQHFLDENLNLIIDQDGNCEIDQLAIKVDAKYFDGDQVEISENQKERKHKSEYLLKENNIKVNKNLPYLQSEETITIRDAKEIATRVTILIFTNLVAFNDISGDVAITEIKKHKLWDAVTPNEKMFLENPTEERKNQETWKCEGIWLLMWALNVVDELGFPSELANLKNIPFESYPVGQNKDPHVFINQQTTLRSSKEIIDANDLYYRMSWASVDARINNVELTEIHGGVVYERHYALNWLTKYRDQEWDAVSCDT